MSKSNEQSSPEPISITRARGSAGTEYTLPKRASAAGSDSPVLQPPRHRQGSADLCYSPLQLFATTRIERTDVSGCDESLFFVEEIRDTVDPRGILVQGDWFTDDALADYITTEVPKNRRPTLAIRYNAALAARGVLDEVWVYVMDGVGRYDPLCRCRRRRTYLADVDTAEVQRLQHKYLRHVEAQRSRARNQLIGLQAVREAVDRLKEKLEARAAEQRHASEPPIPSTPIYLGGTGHAKQELQDVLQRARTVVDRLSGADDTDDVARTRGNGSRRRTRGGNKRRGKTAKTTPRLSGARKGAQPSSGNTSTTPPSTLGDALGTNPGFTD